MPDRRPRQPLLAPRAPDPPRGARSPKPVYRGRPRVLRPADRRRGRPRPICAARAPTGASSPLRARGRSRGRRSGRLGARRELARAGRRRPRGSSVFDSRRLLAPLPSGRPRRVPLLRRRRSGRSRTRRRRWPPTPARARPPRPALPPARRAGRRAPVPARRAALPAPAGRAAAPSSCTRAVSSPRPARASCSPGSRGRQDHHRPALGARAGSDGPQRRPDRRPARRATVGLWIYGTPWHGEAGLACEPAGAARRRASCWPAASATRWKRLGAAEALSLLLARSFPPFHDAGRCRATLEVLDGRRALRALPALLVRARARAPCARCTPGSPPEGDARAALR